MCISQGPDGYVLMSRITIVVACVTVVAVCVLLNIERVRPGAGHDNFRVYCGDSLAVVATLGLRVRPPPCLVVNAAGDPIPNFIIEGVDGLEVNSYKSDEDGKTEFVLGRYARIRDIEVDMRGVSAITVVLRRQ